MRRCNLILIRCDNCVGSNECEKEFICDDYFPDLDKISIEEYESDLHMRYAYYMELIEEYN